MLCVHICMDVKGQLSGGVNTLDRSIKSTFAGIKVYLSRLQAFKRPRHHRLLSSLLARLSFIRGFESVGH